MVVTPNDQPEVNFHSDAASRLDAFRKTTTTKKNLTFHSKDRIEAAFAKRGKMKHRRIPLAGVVGVIIRPS